MSTQGSPSCQLFALGVFIPSVLFIPFTIFAPQQRFEARVDVVRLEILVTDKARPILNLKATDFEILDNGVPQQIELFDNGASELGAGGLATRTGASVPVNAILALDLSDSVAGDKLTHLRTAGHALLGALKPKDQAALVGFSHALVIGPTLTTDLAAVGTALDTARPSGSTSLVDACFAGLIVGESDTGRSLVIVFSDGLDTASYLTTDEVLDTAKRTDAVVYGVSVAGTAKTPFLSDLAAATGGSLSEISTARDLGTKFLAVLDEFRQRYLISYTPHGVAKQGWHRIDVRVKSRPDLKVKVRPGYLAGS